VEGFAAFEAAGDDLVDDGSDVPHHLPRSNSQDGDAMRVQPAVTLRIVCRVVPHIVADAVDLDRERRLSAVEVEDVGPGRMLAAQF